MRKPRVLWVTNLAAPYRLPVWDHLASRFDLRIALLENQQRLAADHGANRGQDWVPSHARVPMHEVRTLRAARGEARFYLDIDPRSARWVSRSDAVVLGGWESPAYWQALALAKLSRTATIGFYESTLHSQGNAGGPVAGARSAFFRRLDKVVVPGPAASQAITAMGVGTEHIAVGFNAIDTARFREASNAPDAPGGHRFLYVGQLIERKRVDAIIAAFAETAGPTDTLRIIGRGPLREALQAQAAATPVASRVSWRDYVPNAEMPDEMSHADTLVLASDEEVWGLVVNEALAAGLQAVITENCGVVPSVRGMRGVVLAADATTLGAAMRRAREGYRGRIREPEILHHTPERFAETFTAAITEAIDERR